MVPRHANDDVKCQWKERALLASYPGLTSFSLVLISSSGGGMDSNHIMFENPVKIKSISVS